jgi:hypothetical protein
LAITVSLPDPVTPLARPRYIKDFHKRSGRNYGTPGCGCK